MNAKTDKERLAWEILVRKELGEHCGMAAPWPKELFNDLLGITAFNDWYCGRGDRDAAFKEAFRLAAQFRPQQEPPSAVEPQLKRRNVRIAKTLDKMTDVDQFEFAMAGLIAESVWQYAWPMIVEIRGAFEIEQGMTDAAFEEVLRKLIEEDVGMATEARFNGESLLVEFPERGFKDVKVSSPDSRLGKVNLYAKVIAGELGCNDSEALSWVLFSTKPRFQLCRTRLQFGGLPGNARIIVEASPWATAKEVGQAFAQERSKTFGDSMKRPQARSLFVLSLAYGLIAQYAWGQRFEKYKGLSQNMSEAYQCRVAASAAHKFKHHCESLRRRSMAPKVHGTYASIFERRVQMFRFSGGVTRGRPGKRA